MAGDRDAADGDAAFAAEIAAEIDRAFVGAMRRAPARGGREISARHGGRPATGCLVEFRTSLAWPGRVVTWRQFAAVTRYRDAVAERAALDVQAGHGTLAVDGAGISATASGRAFLTELFAHQSALMAQDWPDVAGLVDLVGAILDAAAGSGGDAFAAMAPPYEPPGMSAGGLLLNRLGTLRYHRADAHATAWRAAGLTAAEIQALPAGPERAAIEAETDRLAAPPFSALADADRRALLAGLRALA